MVKAVTQFFPPLFLASLQSYRVIKACLCSKGLKELYIKQHHASVYDTQSQGVLERFHQTLTSLLHAYCTELYQDWEEDLLWTVLTAREVVRECTGFSQNYLVWPH